ncbi:hypothetical protein CRG98_004407 [Punica granatum]|uniref:G-patch domain-containing protein n=1 Tax=Punica granatum TaxID=22663 RepID=A0A2I0L3I0_PUNGR|nr:hypothetical protein CRG98_004407 [Punica granatum]
MINIYALGEDESEQDGPSPFMIEYIPTEATVGFTSLDTPPTPFVIDVPAQEPYLDSKVPWTYEGDAGGLEHSFNVMGVTRSRRVYKNPEVMSKGKAPAAAIGAMPDVASIPPNEVTEEEVEAFMKIIKASEYKAVEQMAKPSAHISLLALFLSSEPHREALLRMNVDLNRIRPSKTAVRAFFGSRKEVNEETDLLIDVGPCSFSVTFQALDIPNAFNLLLERLWIHSAGAVPSSLHQRLKFIVEEKLITVKGEEDYAIYKETAIPYISIGYDENLPFHSFETISVIRDYEEVVPSRADRMIGKVLLRHNYIPGTGLGAHGQGSTDPLKSKGTRTGEDSAFAPPAMRSLKPAKATTSTASPHTMGSSTGAFQFPRSPISFLDRHTSSGTPLTAPPWISITRLMLYKLCMPSPRRFLQRFTSASRGRTRSSTTGPQFHATQLRLPTCKAIYDSRVPEIEESLRRLENRQLTSVEPTEEINVGIEDEPRTLKIRTGLDQTQRAWMIDFLRRYQEVFAWSYTDMPGLDPSIVKHFLPLDTKKFPPKRHQLRRQRVGLLLYIKEKVPPPQGQQGGAAQPRPRRQDPSLPDPLSYIYRQLRAGNKIETIAPGPNFDPTTHDQSKHCENHRRASGHTLDNCWRLQERIQEMIDAKELSFNAVRSPNVQANPLPDHGPAQRPSINMINICALGEDESEQDGPSPFMITHIPTEATVGFTSLDTPPTPFVIDVPAREPYLDSKVPWTYEGDAGGLEHSFNVMSVTRSGRVYKNPEVMSKGKALAAAIRAMPVSSSVSKRRLSNISTPASSKSATTPNG